MFQWHPIFIGLMAAVAIGTAAFTMFTMNTNNQYSYEEPTQNRTYYSPPITPKETKAKATIKPPASIKKSNSNAKKRKEEWCTICSDFWKPCNLTLDCNCKFHRLCYNNWLKYFDTCPNCST